MADAVAPSPRLQKLARGRAGARAAGAAAQSTARQHPVEHDPTAQMTRMEARL